MISSLLATAKNLRLLTISPFQLSWHPNHERTRWFLVLRVTRPKEDEDAFEQLLEASNKVARDFDCLTLYSHHHQQTRKNLDVGKALENSTTGSSSVHDAFHISIGWSLSLQKLLDEAGLQTAEIMRRVRDMQVSFSDVKIKLGKDVTSNPFGSTRPSKRGILG